MDAAFERVQERLGAAWHADLPGSTTPHLVVAIPSYSLDPVLLSHYAPRLAALEERYLFAVLLLRNPGTRLAYVTSVPVPDYLVEYFLGLDPGLADDEVRRRLTLVSLDDPSPRPISAKLLKRPDLLRLLRELAGDEPALIEPWTVSGLERDLAVALRMPIYGPHPQLQRFGSKSGSRRIFAEEGVPLPAGVEGVATPDDVAASVSVLRRGRPGLRAVVVKLDDSAAGDGNALLDLTGLPPAGSARERQALLRRMFAMPGWYVQKLEAGGVVEEWVEGRDRTSPSVQLSITPGGKAVVVSTHEQILGGHSGQVYEGCRLPANPAYAREIAVHGLRVARRLAREGVVGRFSVDFVAHRDETGGWSCRALEINLRKGGTTHPIGTMRMLLGGGYDIDHGTYAGPDGEPRFYVSTDNLVDSGWSGLDPQAVIEWTAGAGLSWDPVSRTGVVLHMLECLRVDGRFGLTAIGATRDQAELLYAAVPAVLRERQSPRRDTKPGTGTASAGVRRP